MLRVLTLVVATLLCKYSAYPGQSPYSANPGQAPYSPISPYPQQPQFSQQPQYQQGPNSPQPAVPWSPADQGEAADQQHGVARVSFLGGDVNLQRGDSSELVAAVVNAPLLSRDRLQTAPGSSAEVQLDGGTIVRLAQNTDVGFADLQYGRTRLQFGAGILIFRSLRDTQMQVDIETPSIAIHALGAADLRVSVLENGSTQLTVRAGAADIYGPGGTQRLEAPRSVLVRANPSGPEFQEAAAEPRDALDDWSASRDNQILSSASYQYTGGEMAGIGDLDANGAWVSSQYGPVWTPRSPNPGWAPYSDGQWVNEPYYGWTWVDAAPWGWAPFHYGRWFQNGGRGWCWWPGALGFRHSWGPAYVGFFGFGGGGSLGWVALAPFEGFHTWWGRGGYRGNGGFNSFRSGVYGNYQNAGFRGGAVGVSFTAFGGGRGRFNAVSREAMAGAVPIRGQLPVNGTGHQFGFVDRQAVPNPSLSGAGNRSFFRAPQGQTARMSSGGFSAAQPSYRGSSGPSSNAGWQRFGDPRGSATYRQGFTLGQGESGWHQFGQPDRSGSSSQQSYRAQPYQAHPYRAQPYRAQPYQSQQYRSQPYQAQPNRSYSNPAPAYRPAFNPPQARSFSGNGGGGGGQQYHSNPPPRNESNSRGGGDHSNARGGGSGSGHRR